MRCRIWGSLLRWFWLAISIRGKSQQVNTSNGDDNGSTPKYILEKSHPVSVFHLNQYKVVNAIIRLWEMEVVHSHFLGINHEIGYNIIVGIIIFSIVED